MIWITNNHIIQQSDINSDNMIEGYCLLTERFVRINKSIAILIPDSIVKLLKDKKAQYLLARSIGKTQENMAKIFGVDPRTIARFKNLYDSNNT